MLNLMHPPVLSTGHLTHHARVHPHPSRVLDYHYCYLRPAGTAPGPHRLPGSADVVLTGFLTCSTSYLWECDLHSVGRIWLDPCHRRYLSMPLIHHGPAGFPGHPAAHFEVFLPMILAFPRLSIAFAWSVIALNGQVSRLSLAHRRTWRAGTSHRAIVGRNSVGVPHLKTTSLCVSLS